MARYINVDEVLNKLPDDLPYKASVKRVLIQAPTADVVERAELMAAREEVDRLKHILDSYALQYGTVKDQHAVIANAKSEVAREIFEELEMFLNAAIDGWKKERRCCYHDRDIEKIDFRNGAFKYCLHEIFELKQKYVGGERDERQG